MCQAAVRIEWPTAVTALAVAAAAAEAVVAAILIERQAPALTDENSGLVAQYQR